MRQLIGTCALLAGCASTSMETTTLKMETKVTGPLSGTPLVLVPGGLTGWLSWEAHAEKLSATRRTIRAQLLSVQLGLEDRALPADYALATESAALAAAIEGVGAPIDLVGWSYGAAVALHYALEHPSRVRSLTLIEPPAFWVLGGELDSAALELRALVRGTSEAVSFDELERFVRGVGMCPPNVAREHLPHWPVWVKHRRSLRSRDATFRHVDRLERLAAFEPPVLLVKGTGSATFLHAIIDRLGKKLPHAEVIELPQGHAPQIVSIDTFLKKLAAFQAEPARF